MVYKCSYYLEVGEVEVMPADFPIILYPLYISEIYHAYIILYFPTPCMSAVYYSTLVLLDTYNLLTIE